MAKEVRIHLTPSQKAKIKSATGKNLGEIRVSPVGKNLSAKFTAKPVMLQARRAAKQIVAARATRASVIHARKVAKASIIHARQTTRLSQRRASRLAQ